jgi:hypothetical protein
MFSFVTRIKDRETAELLVDCLESYRRLYEYKGADSLRTFLRGATSSYRESTPHSGDGSTTTFQFDNELSDFAFTGALDPRYAPGGPKGLQVQAEGLGPYLGFLASVNLIGRRTLLFVRSGQSATRRAKMLTKILLNELDAVEYDQGSNRKASEAQLASPRQPHH